MSKSIPFQLHVESMLGIPDIGDDYIQYAAPNIVKLEIGTYTTVNTGIRIYQCQTQGEIHVSLAEPYDSMIDISKNTFDPYYKPQLTVRLYNKSEQYIRIAPEDSKLFKYKWISTEPTSESPESESVEPESVEPVSVEPESVEPVSVEPESVESESVEPESVESESPEPESPEPESPEPTSESVDLESPEPESPEPTSESVDLESPELEALEPTSESITANKLTVVKRRAYKKRILYK